MTELIEFTTAIKNFPRNSPIMAIDLGSKNIGIAICDPKWNIATPLKTILRAKQKIMYPNFKKIIEDYNISSVIFGLPLNMDGTKGKAVQSVRDFAKNFSDHFGLPIAFWDERLSTQIMEEIMIDFDISRSKRKKAIDHLAAQFILSSALDYISNVKEPI